MPPLAQTDVRGRINPLVIRTTMRQSAGHPDNQSRVRDGAVKNKLAADTTHRLNYFGYGP